MQGRSGVPGGRAPVPPVPLERGRARGILLGLGMFALGFALAALALALGGSGSPPYLVAITAGFVGIGLVGFFLNRGTVPLPETRIWSPTGIAALSRPLGLPALPVTAVLYTLAGLGVLGNLVIPLLLRRR